jgi:hypothetical protein
MIIDDSQLGASPDYEWNHSSWFLHVEVVAQAPDPPPASAPEPLTLTCYCLRSVWTTLWDDISDQGERRTAKTVAKITANCKVVLGTSEGKIPETHGATILLPADTTDNENALIVGSKLPENSYMPGNWRSCEVDSSQATRGYDCCEGKQVGRWSSMGCK